VTFEAIPILKNHSGNGILSTCGYPRRSSELKEKDKMEKKDNQQIMQEFRARQSRQIIAIAIALFLILLCAVLYKRPILHAEFSKGMLFSIQIACIAVFIAFTSYNWRCPSCFSFLGSDIHRRGCKKCGMRLS
jgi:hypothetical protein